MNTLPAVRARHLPIAWLLGLMGLTLVAVGMARWQGWQDRVPDAPTAWEMSLRFEDMPDGSVRVSDAAMAARWRSLRANKGFYAAVCGPWPDNAAWPRPSAMRRWCCDR